MRGWGLGVLTSLLLVSVTLPAQVTPNLGLNLPPASTLNWNVPLNANFTTLDTLLSCFGHNAAGTLCYANGAGWTTLAPNASGTQVLTSSNLGILSWASATCPSCGLLASPLSQFASTSSAQLASIISDETGSGPLMFATSPSVTSSLTLGGVTGTVQCIHASSLGVLSGTGSDCGNATVPNLITLAQNASSSAIQAALSAATAGQIIQLTGSSSACSLTSTVSNIVITGTGRDGTSLQCATANAPVLTVSGTNVTIANLNLKHITNSPTCPGGALTSTCGDGLQVLGGSSRILISNVHTNFNYHGKDLGYTSYGEIVNSQTEFNNGDGNHFTFNSSNPIMQWEVRGDYAAQNLGDGNSEVCPAGFTSVQLTSAHWYNSQTYGNAGKGWDISCSAATTSGIADPWLFSTFASTNNGSNYYIDQGPNGGRNAIINGFYAELAGQFSSTAGFAQATQAPSGTGWGIQITSSCDPTPPPNITGGTLWKNSSGEYTSACSVPSSIGNVSTYDSSPGQGVINQMSPVNFSSLTACSSALEGRTATVKNSSTATWGATITGGGSSHVLAYCDGTNWTVAAQ